MKFIAKIAIVFLVCSCYSGGSNSERLNKERMENFSLVNNDVRSIDHAQTVDIIPAHLNVKNTRVSEFYTDREFIHLETPKEIIIGEISRIRVTENHILILDERIAKTVFLFDSNGKYLFTVGKRGGGPGEYDEPIDIQINNSIISLIDRSFTIYEYGFNNEFLRKKELPFFTHSSYLFNDGSRAFSNNTTSSNDLNYQIISLNDNEIVGSFRNRNRPVISKYASQELSNNAKIHRESFLFFEPWGTEVYQMSKDKIELRYRLITDNPAPDEIFSDFDRFDFALDGHAYLYNWPILESDDKVLFRVKDVNRFATIIHDKNTNTLSAYQGMIDDLFYGGIADFPIHSYGEDYYVPMNVERMYAVKKEVEAITDTELLKELQEARPEVFSLFPRLDDLSNPILMKCKISD